MVFLALRFGALGANGLWRVPSERRVEALSSSDTIETIGSALAALALTPPAAGGGRDGGHRRRLGLAEHERHGYERAEQEQGDRPQPALHELAPGVGEELHPVTPAVAVVVGGVLPLAGVVPAAVVPVAAPAGPWAVAPAVRPCSLGSE